MRAHRVGRLVLGAAALFLLGSGAGPVPALGASFVYQSVNPSVSGLGELETTLEPRRLFIWGDTVATAEVPGATAHVDIAFALDEAAPVYFSGVWTAERHNAPLVTLQNVEFGFILEFSQYLLAPAIPSCGTLSMDECFALINVFTLTGGTLPAGDYEISFDLFAFIPMGSCQVGCGSAGGSTTLQIIPEPASATLLGAALALLGAVRRARHRDRRRID